MGVCPNSGLTHFEAILIWLILPKDPSEVGINSEDDLQSDGHSEELSGEEAKGKDEAQNEADSLLKSREDQKSWVRLLH